MIDIPSPFPGGISPNLEQAYILQPEIRLVISPDGTTNFPFREKPGEAIETLPHLFIKRLEIENARFQYDNLRHRMSAVDQRCQLLYKESHVGNTASS